MLKNVWVIVVIFLTTSLIFPQITLAQKAAGSSAISIAQNPEVETDNRGKILKAYLTSHNSPLTSSSDTFVKTADKYNLDWKLVAAISGVESTFGQQIPHNSYNAWGWGIYGDHRIYFGSWDEGIETISKGLRENYIDKWGADDVYEIGRSYAASPTWAQRVTYFMEKIDTFASKDVSSLSISL